MDVPHATKSNKGKKGRQEGGKEIRLLAGTPKYDKGEERIKFEA
jgi:hypothetical protein